MGSPAPRGWCRPRSPSHGWSRLASRSISDLVANPLILRTAAVAAALVIAASAVAPVGTQPRTRLNPLIAKLEAGEIAYTGRDWSFIDMEHGPYLLDRLQTTLAGIGKKATGQF